MKGNKDDLAGGTTQGRERARVGKHSDDEMASVIAYYKDFLLCI